MLRSTWYGAAILVIGSTAVLMAQRPEVPEQGSLAALTAEIHQLRLAVEESTRSARQTQAIGVYLTVQQSRLVTVEGRLDAARKEADTVRTRIEQLSAQLAVAERVALDATNPQERTRLQAQIGEVKGQLEKMTAQEQSARNRAAEASQLLQTEDARWTNLISTLEQLIQQK
jgi:hypothetical protein